MAVLVRSAQSLFRLPCAGLSLAALMMLHHVIDPRWPATFLFTFYASVTMLYGYIAGARWRLSEPRLWIGFCVIFASYAAVSA